MSTKSYSGKEFCRLLEQHGWQLKRTKGSHHIYGKPGELALLVVPVHANRALKPGLQHKLIKLARLPE